MKLIGANGINLDVDISLEELIIFQSALNEVLNALSREDFSTRIGAEVEEVDELLKETMKILEVVRANGFQ